jgi:glucokinase
MTSAAVRVLAGDVGGTKTVLALYEHRETGWVEVASTRFASAEYPGLEAPAHAFLAGVGARTDAAAIGIAGPVVNGRCDATNLPWVVDARALGAALGIERVALVNDFEATALGLLELEPRHLVVLQAGSPDPDGPIAVIGAGTGLGEAILLRTPSGPRVLPTEGGHATLAARDAIEENLVRFLRRRFTDHVSWERAVSGPGLARIHEYVLEAGLAKSHPATLARMRSEDPSAVVGELGTTGADPGCARALDLFVSLYGAEAGNLALKSLPTGGLFVAGGIAPKILPAIQRGVFLEAFLAKGRMRPVLERIPVAVVVDSRVGLYGARALAARLATA